jgi:hypothetical protein
VPRAFCPEQIPLNDGSPAVSTGLRAVVLALPLAVSDGFLAPYDAPKAWWLQAIVVYTALACLLQRAQQADAPPAFRPDRALVVLRAILAAYAAWWLLTTIMSVAPVQSLVGSLARGFGLLTVLAAVALFPLVQEACRTADLRRCLIDAALLGSAVVCLLALGQAFGLDGLPVTVDNATRSLRVRATLGQHVLLGSYLALLIPLAAARFLSVGSAERVSYGTLALASAWVAGGPLLVWLASARPVCWPLLPLWGILAAVAWDRARRTPEERVPGVSQGTLLGALLTVQVLVITLSGARGPFLGAIVGVTVVAVLSWRHRTVAALRPARGGVLAILVCLAVLLGSAAPLAGVRTIPTAQRAVNDTSASDSAVVRLRAWSRILGFLGQQAEGREVMPGQNPWLRSAIGYGLDTQEFVLDSVVSRRGAWGPWPSGTLRYVFDRAHNRFFDHLVTGGLGAALIWIALLGGIVIVGTKRLGASADEDWPLRAGCLGAVLGHVVEGSFGVETAVPFALLWMIAAMLTASVCPGDAETRPPRRTRLAWMGLLAGVAAMGVVAIAATSVWLLASRAYTRGIFDASAGRLDEARLELNYATALEPSLTAPRRAAAEVGLRMAARQPDPSRRSAMLREAEALLADARGGAFLSGDIWLMKAKVALARAEDGQADQLRAALAAFAMADRLRANDADVLTPWSIALLRDGQTARARELAERVLSTNDGDWLAWAVLARASAATGDTEKGKHAAAEARRLAPPGAGAFLDRFQ